MPEDEIRESQREVRRMVPEECWSRTECVEQQRHQRKTKLQADRVDSAMLADPTKKRKHAELRVEMSFCDFESLRQRRDRTRSCRRVNYSGRQCSKMGAFVSKTNIIEIPKSPLSAQHIFRKSKVLEEEERRLVLRCCFVWLSIAQQSLQKVIPKDCAITIGSARGDKEKA